MPASEYVQGLRSRIGNDFLLLPAVTAVIQNADRFLLARHRDSQLWSLVGGGIEPGERPEAAVQREVFEELGVKPALNGVIGAYGGRPLENTYPNGDRVGYVTVAYCCSLPKDDLALDRAEILETRWVSMSEVRQLARHEWIDQILDDAAKTLSPCPRP